MTKKTIIITVKQDSKEAEMFQVALEQKENFRKAVEMITSARNQNTPQPQRVQPV
jgi:hypothetical protein